MTHRELRVLTISNTGNPRRHSRVTDEVQKAFSNQFKESTDTFLNELKQLLDQTLERLCGHCTVLNDNIHSCLEQITTSMSEMGSKIAEEIGRKETSNGNDTREAQIIKNNISQYWKNNLHDRKSAYWKHFRSMKLADLYKEICPEENPFVLRKFRMTINETTHQEGKDL